MIKAGDESEGGLGGTYVLKDATAADAEAAGDTPGDGPGPEAVQPAAPVDEDPEEAVAALDWADADND